MTIISEILEPWKTSGDKELLAVEEYQKVMTALTEKTRTAKMTTEEARNAGAFLHDYFIYGEINDAFFGGNIPQPAAASRGHITRVLKYWATLQNAVQNLSVLHPFIGDLMVFLASGGGDYPKLSLEEAQNIKEGDLFEIKNDFYDFKSHKRIMKVPEEKRTVMFIGPTPRPGIFKVLYGEREIIVGWRTLMNTGSTKNKIKIKGLTQNHIDLVNIVLSTHAYLGAKKEMDDIEVGKNWVKAPREVAITLAKELEEYKYYFIRAIDPKADTINDPDKLREIIRMASVRAATLHNKIVMALKKNM